MVRLRQSGLIKTLAALLLGVCLLGLAPPAQANYTYQVFDDGAPQGGIVTPPPDLSNPPDDSFSTGFITTDHFRLTIASSATSPNQLGTTLFTNLQAQLKVGVTGSHTITVKLNYDDYTLPAGSPLNVSTAASATFTNTNVGDQATFQAWGSTANSSVFQSGTTSVQQSVTYAGGNPIGLALNPNPTSFLFTNTGTFSLSQTLSLSLSNGTTNAGQVQGTSTVTVPAPAGLALALAGLPALAVGGWMRRRNTVRPA